MKFFKNTIAIILMISMIVTAFSSCEKTISSGVLNDTTSIVDFSTGIIDTDSIVETKVPDVDISTFAATEAETVTTKALGTEIISDTATVIVSDTILETIITSDPIDTRPKTQFDGLRICGTNQFFYNGKLYSYSNYSSSDKNAEESYRKMALKYKDCFTNSRVSVLLVPGDAMLVTDSTSFYDDIPSQKMILDDIEKKYAGTGISFINIYDDILQIRNELLHENFCSGAAEWEGQAPFAAYSCFVRSIGLKPTSSSVFIRIQEESKERSLDIYDPKTESMETVTVQAYKEEIYHSQKPIKRRIMNASKQFLTYNDLISASQLNYKSTSEPYIEIVVPDNPQGRSILILGDQMGQQMIQMFIETYGKIYVIDTRFNNTPTILQEIKENPTDIIFVNYLGNALHPNQYWSKAFTELLNNR